MPRAIRVRGRAVAAGLATLAAGLSGGAAGAEGGLVSELKLGVQTHDAGLFGPRDEDGVDINLEVLFAPLEPLAFIWSPRPHAGAHLNTAGDTSQLYLGLTWTFDVPDAFWVAVAAGGAAHTGKLSSRHARDKRLGSRVLFRVALEVGVTLAERHRLSVMLDHVSNAELVDENEGLDTVGLRYGYRF